MKTIIVCLLFITGLLKAGEIPAVKKTNYESIPTESFWVKSDVGMWLASYNVWYKIDKKNFNIKLSYNKKRWKSSSDAVWHDNHGRWYCISENKMMYSDNGKNWNIAVNRTWQDMNGTWFRFDTNFNLYQVVQ